MVLMLFFFFVLAWIFSPKYGLFATLLRRANQRRHFDDQVVLGHIYNHADTDIASEELDASTLHQHFRWSQNKMQRVLTRLRAIGAVTLQDGLVHLTTQGEAQVQRFRAKNLATTSKG
jgi:manganese/zinc/iron transport system permease protein